MADASRVRISVCALDFFKKGPLFQNFIYIDICQLLSMLKSVNIAAAEDQIVLIGFLVIEFSLLEAEDLLLNSVDFDFLILTFNTFVAQLQHF